MFPFDLIQAKKTGEMKAGIKERNAKGYLKLLFIIVVVSLFVLSCTLSKKKNNVVLPSVVSIKPAKGATDVAPNTAIVVTFSAAVDASTVTASTCLVRDGNNTLISGSVLVSGTTALFIPSSLAPSTTYEVTITTGVKDVLGKSLADNYSWNFTTAPAISEQQSPFGFDRVGIFTPGYGSNGYTDAQTIGVTWARTELYAYWFLVQPDLSTQTYDFSQYDQQYGSIPAGINILGNIAPDSKESTHAGYTNSGSFTPLDESKYTAFVTALVERYDGDGVDDMPGLVNPVKYWQVGNEPSAEHSGFADLQRITYVAIKAACPDCTVLIGGAPGLPPAASYKSNFDTTYRPILDELGGKYVDIMDFHWYGNATGDYRAGKDVYDHVRSVLDADGFSGTPIWITEMGSFSGAPISVPQYSITYPPQTERQQALDIVKRYVYPLSFGIKKIFPCGLMEGFRYDGGYFDYTGLIYDGWGVQDPGLGVKKLGYYAYEKMTEKLEGLDMNDIMTVLEDNANNVYVYRFMKNGNPVYVAWWDFFNEAADPLTQTRQVSLTSMPSGTLVITEALPNQDTGAQVTDYQNNFRSYTITSVSGTVVLNLGDSPVYVELQ